MQPIQHAPWHTKVAFHPEQMVKTVQWIAGIVKQHKFTAVAGSGHSGLVVCGAVGFLLKIPVIAVRKEGDSAKGDSTMVNAMLDMPVRYAFVDDLIGTGETLTRVEKYITKELGADVAKLAGIILYRARYVPEPIVNEFFQIPHFVPEQLAVL